MDDLRTRIAEALQVAVKSYRLPDVGVRLGLAPGTGSEAHSSKRIYVQKRIDTWDEAQLLKLATAVVEEYGSSELADLLSELTTHADHRLSKLTRREILKTTNSLDLLFGDQSSNLYHDLGVIAPRWDVGIYPDRPFHSLKDEVEQHYIRNPDWNNAELLEHCGALECSQSRFFSLLETLLHPLSHRGDTQALLLTGFNELLKADDFTASVIGYESGHAIYRILRLASGVVGTPKNLIFASIGQKPELVLTDAINNDVKIVKHADQCVIYDRPLSPSGLKWVEMAQWWQETRGLSDLKTARQSLGRRLQKSVEHTQSVPERALFKTYYTVFSSRLADQLPALIPQVYLHYDPQTLIQRGGRPVLPRQRMDFLMLLERQARIVLEVDGKHHYARGETASPALYSEMAHEDRALRLQGYEVYRFGAAEFADTQIVAGEVSVGPKTEALLVEFFEQLFQRHWDRLPTRRFHK